MRYQETPFTITDPELSRPGDVELEYELRTKAAQDYAATGMDPVGVVRSGRWD